MKPFLVVALLLLAGCASNASDSSSGPGHDAATHAMLMGFAVPTWRVGDSWTWESDQLGTYTYVVTADNGQDYTMDTDSEGLAFFDARNDVSTLGAIRKSDLAGSQGSTRVEFFKFPMKQNVTWSTSWDGEPLQVKVLHMMPEMAHIEARRGDGSLFASYSYVNATGYFGDLNFYDANSTLAFGGKVTSHARGHTGELVRYTLDTLASVASDLQGSSSTTYTVGPMYTDVWMALNVECSQGAFLMAAGPPTGHAEQRGISAQGACPMGSSMSAVEPAPAADETWGAVVVGNPGNVGSGSLTVIGRVLETFTAGS